MDKGVTETDRFVFFWSGWPSQWHPTAFIVDGVRYNCCEQFMMAEKAHVFGDEERMASILETLCIERLPQQCVSVHEQQITR